MLVVMTETSTEPFTREVLLSTPRRFDLEIHVSKIGAPEGLEYADIREFIPSLGQYGRGILLPVDKIASVADALLSLSGSDG